MRQLHYAEPRRRKTACGDLTAQTVAVIRNRTEWANIRSVYPRCKPCAERVPPCLCDGCQSGGPCQNMP